MANLGTIDLDRFATVARNAGIGNLSDSPALTLAQEGRVSVQWAPFDHAPPTARLVLVGITPGREQAENGLRAFRQALVADAPLVEALRRAKLAGSFSGSQMRTNIVDMLDSVGVNRALGVPGCAALFEPAHELVHFTSALRYPAFVDCANYNGTPDMLRTPLLRQMVETFLAAEARALPGALWLPLGPKPAAALRHLVSRGVLPAGHVLKGMPHPSGANSERIKFFLGLKPRSALSAKTPPEPIERAREALLAQVAQLRVA
ncbi:hypothetical protein [Limobrevibacterium gyesilva]|uniref:Uracil DNA glycosylase superfamily protein n=1 Tax=Limobrevibacterium gyesilva TaxID=2991712 RepID=A0AA41YVR3_9PROT|nr:hypothetical protein [Limobrevibacterium gyesilva]MCW3476277.1 hypothetical protein [Limobrevibacterium gyesilva]